MAKALASRIRAANSTLLVEGDLDAIDEFFARDYVAHLTGRDMTGGHAAIRRVLIMYRRAFRDLRVDVEILVKAGDRIAWQRTLRGTHEGDFKGYPGTGRPIVWRDMVISRFRGGLMRRVGDTDLAERLLLARKR